MAWYFYIVYFLAGIFLANGIPHFTNGISGNKFQSPFASPPGIGESSALVNVLWGLVNFLIGSVLLSRVGGFDGRFGLEVIGFGLGFILMAIVLVWHFGRVRG